jgi:hypothetical protein
MEHPTTPGMPRIHIVRAALHGVPASGPGCLGVLGGAYNPITNSHLAIADTVVRTFGEHKFYTE